MVLDSENTKVNKTLSLASTSTQLSVGRSMCVQLYMPQASCESADIRL